MDANSFQTRRGQSFSWRDELNPDLADRMNKEDLELLKSLRYTS